MLIGADEGCGGNKIGGSVTLSNNLAGVDLFGNRIGGTVTAVSNSGAPPEDTLAIEISGNTITGGLNCSNNTGVEPDGANTTGGAKTGQCAAL